jgi:hypothetical protein
MFRTSDVLNRVPASQGPAFAGQPSFDPSKVKVLRGKNRANSDEIDILRVF